MRITASSSDPIMGVELSLTPTGHTWAFGLELICSVVVSSSSLFSPMAKLFAPLLGSWARYSRHEGALLRMSMLRTKCLHAQAASHTQLEVSTRGCPCVHLHPISVQPQSPFPTNEADVLLPHLQTPGPSTLCTGR